MSSTGAESTARTVPDAVAASRSNVATSWPTSVVEVLGRPAPRGPRSPGTRSIARRAQAGSSSRSGECRVELLREGRDTRRSTSSCVTRGNSSRVPPVVSSGLTTFRKNGCSPRGTTVMALTGTLPSGPGSTAVTFTVADDGTICRPTSFAAGTVIAPSVSKRMPEPVLTTEPAGIVLDDVGSRLSKRTGLSPQPPRRAGPWRRTCRRPPRRSSGSRPGSCPPRRPAP